MAVHSICLLAMLLFSAEAEVLQSNDASATVDMVAQNDDAKLGEDVEVGTYDVLMDETEDNSDDIDEDEITEDESSGLSDDEVSTSFVQVDDESEADGEEKVADDIAEYGDMVDDEEAADIETTQDESEDASLLQADDADGVGDAGKTVLVFDAENGGEGEVDADASDVSEDKDADTTDDEDTDDSDAVDLDESTDGSLLQVDFADGIENADEDVLDTENGGEDKVDADASSESEDEPRGHEPPSPALSGEQARQEEKAKKRLEEIARMSPEEKAKKEKAEMADQARRDAERVAKDKEARKKKNEGLPK